MIINQREDILWEIWEQHICMESAFSFGKTGISALTTTSARWSSQIMVFCTRIIKVAGANPVYLSKGNHRYQFTMNMTCHPENSIYFKLVFNVLRRSARRKSWGNLSFFLFCLSWRGCYTYKVSLVTAGFLNHSIFILSIKEYDRSLIICIKIENSGKSSYFKKINGLKDKMAALEALAAKR